MASISSQSILRLSTETVIAQRYKVLRLLGAGTSGQVYLTADLPLNGRPVAVKIFSEALAQNRISRARIAREVLAGTAVRHDNVVGIYDLIADGQILGYSMEYTEGSDLKSCIQASIDFKGLELQLLLQIAKGISAIHQAGLIHRDLKPANILLTASGIAKIMDLGLVRQCAEELLDEMSHSADINTPTSSRVTHSGSLLGTPLYMDPAYLERGELSQRTDIYAFGLIAYELLSRREPFAEVGADELDKLLEKKRTEDPIPISELCPGLSKSLIQLIETAIQREPEDRFDSIDEVIEQLKVEIKKSKPVDSHSLANPLDSASYRRDSKKLNSRSSLDIELEKRSGQRGVISGFLNMIFRGRAEKPHSQPSSRSRRTWLGFMYASTTLTPLILTAVLVSLYGFPRIAAINTRPSNLTRTEKRSTVRSFSAASGKSEVIKIVDNSRVEPKTP